MSQGFLTWPDFHPLLVGASCLALGYVYGRHCRSISEIPADVPPASDDVCCAQSQSNTYFEDLERPCKCCVSAPAELDAVAVTGSGKKVQDAAEGFEQAERSTKRGLTHRMENLAYADTDAQGMRQFSCGPDVGKGFELLEEERFLEAKTPYKKQKGAFYSKGKAEMVFDPRTSARVKNENDSAALWSREELHKRIDYFNNVSETSAESGRTDESKKLRLIKKKFLQGSAKGEPAYNSTSTPSNTAGVVRAGSTSGLVQLATLHHQGKDNPSPNSPHRISGGGGDVAAVGETSVDAVLLQKTTEAPSPFSLGNSLIPAGGVEADGLGADRDVVNQLLSVAGGELWNSEPTELLQVPSTASPAPEHYERCELREEILGDEVLKAEICELLNEADCSKVSCEEIVSLLEKRLQTNLQERKAHVADLVCEVVSISELLEKDKSTTEARNQASAIQYRVKNARCSRHLGKLPFSYDYS